MPTEPSFSIAAVFPDRAAAEAAIADLETTGLEASSVHLLAQGSDSALPVPAVPIAATYVGGVSSFNYSGFAPGLGAALIGLGGQEKELESLHTRLEKGEALVGVAAGERTAIARTVLERNGGEIVGK